MVQYFDGENDIVFEIEHLEQGEVDMSNGGHNLRLLVITCLSHLKLKLSRSATFHITTLSTYFSIRISPHSKLANIITRVHIWTVLCSTCIRWALISIGSY